MTKSEFMGALERHLAPMSPEERTARLDYYHELFDDMQEEGMSEEEICARLGDPAAIARELLQDLPLTTLIRKLPQGDNVLQVVEQNRLARQSITTATANLLIETLDALGQIIMNHKTHIAFVDSHTKGDCGTDDLHTVVLEIVLHLVTLRIRHSCMIHTHGETVLLQFRSKRFRSLAS